ncbi:MAG: hypothetical protein ACR2HF_15975 [Methylococcaceae bacterium]
MNLLFWLLSGELLLLTASISVGLFFINKRRESRLLDSVAQLLQSIIDSEPEHLSEIRKNLSALAPLGGKNKIEKLGNQLVDEEREFLRELIRILLIQDMNGLTHLHQRLQGLVIHQMEMLRQLDLGTAASGSPSTDDSNDADTDDLLTGDDPPATTDDTPRQPDVVNLFGGASTAAEA